MKWKKFLAFVSAFVVVHGAQSLADAWDPTKLVKLPLFRVNYVGETQTTGTIAFARSDNPTTFKDVTKNDGDPVPPALLPVVAYSSGTATANVAGILSEASSTADARCNTAVSATTYAGSVNVSGTANATAFQTMSSCTGTAISSSVGHAIANFRIDQHPTYETKGEHGSHVTVQGGFDFLVSTTFTGTGQHLSGREFEVSLLSSNLEATAYGAAGWNIQGSLERSSAQYPTLTPTPINGFFGNGMDILYLFSEVADIADEVNTSADVTGNIGTMAVCAAPSSNSGNCTYSVLTFFSVDDYKWP